MDELLSVLFSGIAGLISSRATTRREIIGASLAIGFLLIVGYTISVLFFDTGLASISLVIGSFFGLVVFLYIALCWANKLPLVERMNRHT